MYVDGYFRKLMRFLFQMQSGWNSIKTSLINDATYALLPIKYSIHKLSPGYVASLPFYIGNFSCRNVWGGGLKDELQGAYRVM
jgi:hypothetical protein